LATARAFQAANPGAAADLLLAETLYRTKQHDQAVAVLNKSLAEKPTNTVLLRLSEYAFRAKDAERATAMLSNWLEKNPNDLSVRLAYANVFMGKEDRQRAVAGGLDLDRLLSGLAHDDLGAARLQAGEIETLG